MTGKCEQRRPDSTPFCYVDKKCPDYFSVDKRVNSAYQNEPFKYCDAKGDTFAIRSAKYPAIHDSKKDCSCLEVENFIVPPWGNTEYRKFSTCIGGRVNDVNNVPAFCYVGRYCPNPEDTVTTGSTYYGTAQR